MIWEIENGDEKKKEKIDLYEKYISTILNENYADKDENIETISNFIYCYGSYPVKRHIKYITLIRNINKRKNKI